MERVVVYGRVSTDRQEKQESIETQLMVCRDFCEAHDYDVLAEFHDQAVSGTIPLDERPGGAALLEFVRRERGVTRTVVYNTSRVGRDELVSLLAEKMLRALGAPITSATEPLPEDDKSPFAVMARGNTRTMNAVYRAEVRQNTMNGRYRKVREGTHYLASMTPYGYVRLTERDGRGKLVRAWLEEEPEQAAVVRQMFTWAADGLGLRAIARRLNERNISPPTAKSRSGWHFRSVQKILHARRYIGEGSYADLPMPCSALIDRALWDAAQSQLARRWNDRLARPSQEFYLLKNILFCRRCGSKYTVKTDRVNGTRRYMCRRRREHGPNAGHEGVRWSWAAEELEAKVRLMVQRVMVDPGWLLREANIYDEQAATADAERDAELSSLRRRLAELDEERKRAQRLARKGLLTERELAEQLGEVRAEHRRMDERLRELERCPAPSGKLANWAALVRDFATMRAEAKRTFPDANHHIDGDVDDFVAQLVEQVWVNDDGHLSLRGPLAEFQVDTSSR